MLLRMALFFLNYPVRISQKSCRATRGTQKRLLFLATGALMSQTTFLQKESIPAIAHLVELWAPKKEGTA